MFSLSEEVKKFRGEESGAERAVREVQRHIYGRDRLAASCQAR
jgi:hypothetical protein